MKQVAQRLRDGRVEVVEVPPPVLTPDGVLVDVRASVLSAGTERSKVETARKSLVGKARARPDQARQVLEKVRRDGVRETLDAVRLRLDRPSPLGYSAAGVVLAVGERARGVAVGDRVACGGGDRAVHADVDLVPANLCVPVPEGVALEHAAFATIGSIALHAVRQADVRIGERVGVIGLGLVGQLACQIARAAGCTVVGVDLSPELAELAVASSTADAAFERAALEGVLPPAAEGCDAVVLAAATPSADPVRLAARMCRDRARVVVLGDVGLDVPRAPFYEKELDLRLSRSYGPGRYDVEYEERGLDYPIGYVRWTERRNMAAFLELVASGRVHLDPLVSVRMPVDDAPEAYDALAGGRSRLGVVLTYEPSPLPAAPPPPPSPAARPRAQLPGVGLVGAGSFAHRILAPALRDAGFPLAAVASASSLSASSAATRFGFGRAATTEELLADPAVELVAIATRHDSHARLAVEALARGKDVYLEKPPCLTEPELAELRRAEAAAGRPVHVGFNRRHSPLARALREHVARPEAVLEVLVRVNAAPLPPGHWLDDPLVGGGRLIGEGCHFVDLACWLVGSVPRAVTASVPASDDAALAAAQRFAITLEFGCGSVATILYGTGGAPGAAKEYVELHGGGRSGVLDDFASLTTYDGHRRRRVRTRRRDKGHAEQLRRLAALLRGEAEPEGPAPLDTTAATLAALAAARSGRAVDPRAVGAAAA